MELRAERGRAVLVGAPELFEPPTALAGALDEWAEVAHAVCSNDDTDQATAELVSARGRQLAARLAAAAGTTVGYADPVLGVTQDVPPTPDLRRLGQQPGEAADPAAGTDSGSGRRFDAGHGERTAPWPGADPAGAPLAGADPAAEPSSGSGPVDGMRSGAGPAAGRWSGSGPAGVPRSGHGERPSWAEVWAGPPRQSGPPVSDAPTPWATGLTVSAFTAVVVMAAVVTLVRGLAEVTWLLGAIGLIVVTGGLAPSIWLARHTPLWRWIALGVATGIAVSWVSVILASLGP